jgi:hypothetical protein
MKDIRNFDRTIFAQLYATQQRFQASWKSATTTVDIPRLFRYKPLGKKQGKCTTAEIRAVHDKYRLTICRVESNGQSKPIMYWLSVWRKHSDNDDKEVNAARNVCKSLCSREV